MENAIEVTGVKVSFGDHHVLRGVNCAIEKGSIVTFLGRNGCGKSTLLKTITGNLKPDEGKITIAGRPLSSFKSGELAREVAFLPQIHEIPKDMTGLELVACGRYPYQHWWTGVSTRDREMVANAMRRTNTYHLKDRTVVSLSGGERQRVWIAMALAQEPKILILDEPTTYLDICHQLEVLELVSRLNEEEGLTVVMVLHDINQACRYSKKLLVVENGVIQRAGPPMSVMTPEAIAEVFEVDADMEMRAGRPSVIINGLCRRDPHARLHEGQPQTR